MLVQTNHQCHHFFLDWTVYYAIRQDFTVLLHSNTQPTLRSNPDGHDANTSHGPPDFFYYLGMKPDRLAGQDKHHCVVCSSLKLLQDF